MAVIGRTGLPFPWGWKKRSWPPRKGLQLSEPIQPPALAGGCTSAYGQLAAAPACVPIDRSLVPFAVLGRHLFLPRGTLSHPRLSGYSSPGRQWPPAPGPLTGPAGLHSPAEHTRLLAGALNIWRVAATCGRGASVLVLGLWLLRGVPGSTSGKASLSC